ncbi:hypothetical protein [Methanospirillum sp.]
MDTAGIISAMPVKPDWLVLDHYVLDEWWEGALRPCAHRIFVIDDLVDRVHDCDLLLG